MIDCNNYCVSCERAFDSSLARVPVITAAYLLRRLAPNQVKSPDSIDNVLDRWTCDDAGDVQDLNEGDEYLNTGLTQRQELRCLIGALYGRSYKQQVKVQGTANDEDVARRCAFYGNGKLDVKEVDAGYERDKGVFVFAATLNDDMLHNRKTRRHFEEECLRSNDTHLYKCAASKSIAGGTHSIRDLPPSGWSMMKRRTSASQQSGRFYSSKPA